MLIMNQKRPNDIFSEDPKLDGGRPISGYVQSRKWSVKQAENKETKQEKEEKRSGK